MSELRDLYQEVILDHYKRPRNFGSLDEPVNTAKGYNPLCGDQVTIFVRTEDGRITDVAFEGVGCAISTASASLMTEAVKGKTLEEAEELFESFHSVLVGEKDVEDVELGKLEALSGVREFPVRIKCATLAWHAMRAAMRGDEEKVTTEWRCPTMIWGSRSREEPQEDSASTDESARDGSSADTSGPAEGGDPGVRLRTPFDGRAGGRGAVPRLRPEIPVNIYELGLIYDVQIEGRNADIKMTLTSPHCPVAESLPQQVEYTVESVEGIDKATVEIVWDPAWSPR